MSQILQVHAFLEHSFSKNENLIPDSLKHDLIHQRTQIPYHNIPIHRDGMTGKIVDPDVNFKRSCATATSCAINTANTRVEPTIMKSIHEIRRQALRSTKTEFNLWSCIRKSPDCSGDLPTVPSIIDELLRMASEDVVQNWCFPKGYFLRLTAQINEAGTFLLPKRETITFLKRRIRSCKPRESYATIEDTATPLPTLTKLIQNPALNWDFELDTFQKRAILCLENNKTVFVSAHTSSGKTVIAEYACAICLRRGSRVIYTSPVKALSNQKFHDFRERFGENVGLITGDIKLAQEASLLVMTTEILYNMLCNASEIIKNLEIVILDEVHYINNPDRGYVWEQIMIMLPKHILLVMLSATVPNNYEIADWLGRVRGCEIHVIATDKRPVPLEHYLYTGMTEQHTSHLHLIVDKDGHFIDSGYQAAALSKNTGGPLYRTPACRGKDAFIMHTKNTWLGFVNLLKEQNLMPAIAFAFSRSSVETLAKNLSSVDLTSKSEKQQITKFFSTITGRLRKCDRKLASVKFLHDLTRRGLAVHHSGMLPILKETVELLFRAGLVKILFATETVSTGVNTPARCVVFTSLEKFDGHIRRSLDPSEFTQMAGRAGRRGIDAKGLVIILVSTIGKSLKSSVTGLPTESLLRNMILGRQTRLISRFRVTYSMILNLHRSSSLTPQDIMKRSFMEAASHRWETKQRQHLSVLNKKINETTKIISHNNNTDNNISNIIIQTSTITISTSIEGTSDSFKSLIDSLDVQVKCPHDGVECCDSIGQYYQLCYKYRQLTNSIISTLDVKYAQRLQQIFCPGRLILLQLIVNKSVWLVPAVIINYHWKTKNNDAGNQIMLNVILWELPANLPNSLTVIKKQEDGQSSSSELVLAVSGSDTVTYEQMNNNKNTNYHEYDEIEEEILRNSISEGRTTTIPVPPHLMPVFVPFSLCDGYSRLTRQSVPLSDSLVRICDRIVTFQDMEYNLVDDELLLQSIKQLIIRRKDDTKLLSVDVNNHQFDQHLQVINLALFNCVNSIVPQESALTSAVYYTTLINTPKQMDFKKDLNLVMDDEDICLFDEYSTLNDQLTIPLANGTITAFSSTNLLKCPNLLQHLKLVHQTIRRKFAINSIENNLANCQLQLSNEYTGRLSVLKELGFIDSATQSYCLSFKGFFACELTSKEVLLTQLLLDGFIDDLLAPDIAAVLSAFSNELRAQDLTPEKTTSYYLKELIASINCTASTTTTNYTSNFNLHKDLECIPRHLLLVFKNILTRASELETLQRLHNLTDPYLESRLDLRIVPVVYKWANGYSFSATISKCDIPEGSLIKSLLQLDELIRHISGACRQFGNHILSLKIDEARDLIHRDIVCSPSLYVLQDIKLAKDD
ncbi:unnamed protein product [Schistosoma margrebowiei]|uniref:Helicase ATP-binding domain-containing protein n=1 Tax=Schistosoma margrebowiei TaxID=48269 RepID=A0AA84ZJ45_9TREM|nr:unnamed protein product [Schistosoma margrebowiei]CAH8634372.1 unnamed protein product [Schistosoma margrebowiei]